MREARKVEKKMKKGKKYSLKVMKKSKIFIY